MGAFGDNTAMGGAKEAFSTTCWTAILAARSENRDVQNEQLALLADKYWKPVYCYLRRRGMDNEQAKDAAQDFFHEVIFNRHLFERADPEKGRFRAFLRAALDRYVLDLYDWQTARRRCPGTPVLSLAAEQVSCLLEDKQTASPQEAFEYAWACDVLDRVLEHVRQECTRAGHENHWLAFRERIVTPILENTAPPPLPQICRRYRIQGEERASRILFRIKKRFRSSLREHLRQYAVTDAEVDRELEELLSILSSTRERSA